MSLNGETGGRCPPFFLHWSVLCPGFVDLRSQNMGKSKLKYKNKCNIRRLFEMEK